MSQRLPATEGRAVLGRAVLAMLASLVLVVSSGSTAAAQAPRILIADLTVSEDGTASMEVVVSPDVAPEDVDRGLQVTENGVTVEDVVLTRTTAGDAAGPSAEVALLLDTSGSTATDGALGAAQVAATSFVERVTDEGIPVTLVAFADTAEVLVPASTDAAALAGAIAGLSPSGETALYDAVVAAAGRLESGGADDRRLVLFTDGGDTVSTATLDEATAAVNAAGADLSAVSLTTTETDEAALAQLASATVGGVVLPVANAGQLDAALDVVATSIAERLVATWTVLDRTAPQLEVAAILVTPDGQFTDRARVPSPLAALTPVEGPEPADLPPASTPEPALFGGALALWVGLGAALLAIVLLLVVVFQAPTSNRSAQVLKRQVRQPKQQRRGRGAAESGQDVRIKELVGQVAEALPRPSGYDEKLQLELERAAWPLRSGEFVALRVGLAAAGFFGGGLLAAALDPNPVLPLTLGVLGWFLPRLVLERRKANRYNAFHSQLPEVLQMLAGSLRAGYGLSQGFENVSQEGPAPSATEFGRVLTETRLGVPLEDALAAMAERIGSDDFRWVTVAISIQRRVGGNLAELMDTVAATLREREQVRRQVQVLSAEGRLSAVILVALPIVFMLYLSATRPEYLQPLFTWPVGYSMLAGAVVLLGLGIVWIRNVIRIEV